MTKKQREAKERSKGNKSKRRRGHHKNRAPVFGLPFVPPFGIDMAKEPIELPSGGPLADMVMNSAGTMLIHSALLGVSFQEKAIIASLIPLVLPILRKHGTITIDDALKLPALQSANAEKSLTDNDSQEERQNKKPIVH